MSDQALYRKYRSASFDAVIGQPQVVETLQNAIASDRLSHAYLFTGPRGTGKTSVARLLARAANCTDPDPAKRPCGVCENCKIDIGSHLDLIEIDAASNRGIDDARALREKISSAPSLGRYKVYIIDEVHMLTTEAFNALLKTLEEPPAHALFILATTESHKLPDTIVSRTQRFSFKPIQASDITAHLKTIAKTEKITIDDDSLDLIAQASRGGFRDAISLLDQVGHSGISPITVEATRQLLGQSDPNILGRIVDGVASQQPGVALAAVDDALSQGVQAARLTSQLIEFWRAQLQSAVSSKEVDPVIIHGAASAIEALLPVLKSNWPELSLETALVRLATTSSAPAPVKTTTAPPAPVAVATTAEAKATPAPEAPKSESSANSEELWLKALTLIKQQNNSLYALLRSSVSVQFEDDKVLLGCRFTFHRDRLKETKNIQIIEKALARVYGRKYKVVPQLENKPVAASVATDSSTELVSSALEILGGEVVHE